MNKTITTWAVGLATLVAANVAAEGFSFEGLELGELQALEETLASNGSWQCQCWCAAPAPPDFGSVAEIPGKCDSGTEGKACSFPVDEKRYKGKLELCSHIFIIDK
jgi:hypothetical protein